MENKRTSDLDSFAIGAGVGLVGRFAGRFIGVAAGIITARVLGPAVFGVYAIGLTMFGLAELVTPLGFDVGVIKYGAGFLGRDNRKLKGVILYSLLGSMLFSVLAGLCVYLLSSWLASSVFLKPTLRDVIRLYSFAFPLAGLVGVLAAASRLTRNMIYSAAVQDVGEPLLALAILGIFWLIGLNLDRVVMTDLIAYGLVTALALAIIAVLFPFVFDRRVVPIPPDRHYYGYSFSAAFSMLLGTLVFWVDRLFVGSLLPASQAGIYQSAAQISVVFAVVISGFNRILTPVFSSLYHEKDIGQLEEIYRIGTKWTVYISMPVLILLLLSSKDFLAIVYGDAYSPGALALVVLLIGQLVNLATGSIGPLMLIGGYQRIVILSSALVMGVNALVCFLLIPRFGILGAALANTISVALLNLSALLIVKIKMKVWPYDRRYLKGGAAALTALAAAFLVKTVVVLPRVSEMIVLFAAVTGVFGLVLFLLRIDPEDRALVGLLTRRRTGR
ncbi:MAG TPA: flippase [Anaerolineales bacterium]|nr:flippase [Anaerolineales bacterium]